MKRAIATSAALGGFAIVALAGAYAAHASTARFAHRCEAGRQRVFHIAYVNDSAAAPANVFARTGTRDDTQQYLMKLSGVLLLTDAACERDGTLQIVNFVQPNVELSASSNSGLYRALLLADLARPFVLATDTSGRIRSVGHDLDSGELGAALVRRLTSAMQVVAPESGSPVANVWQADEPDVTGNRTSTYRLDPWIDDPLGDGSLGFHRLSNVDVRPPDQGRFLRHPTIEGIANDTGRWALDGGLATLDRSYVERTNVGGHVVARMREQLELERVSTPAVDDAQLKAIDAYAHGIVAAQNAQPLHVAQSEGAVDLRGYTQTLGHASQASLTHDVRAARNMMSDPERARLARTLAALFYVRPRSVASFAAIAANARVASPTFGVIVRALGQIGTVPAQRALLSLIATRSSTDVDAAANMIGLLALGEHPIADVDLALERIARNVRRPLAQAALLGIGSIATQVASTDRTRAGRLTAFIDRRLAIAHTDDEISIGLLALGNAANPASLSTIARFTTSRSARVRSHAATALRHQQSATADESLVTLLNDSSDDVRVAAASALAERVPGDLAFAKLETIALHDKNPTLRSIATEAIWNARPSRPQAASIVREIANADADGSVRAAAKSQIESATNTDDAESIAPIDALLK